MPAPRLASLLGHEIVRDRAGRIVVDFGCGGGSEALEVARLGARRVICIDIREEAETSDISIPGSRVS